MFTRNVGTPDRVIRIVAGATLVTLAALQVLGPWAWIGIVPLLTGAFGYCPAYPLFGISTCKLRN